MAYQTRGRDPLLDSATQAAIEKRGRELVGLVLVGLGLAVAAMLGSYTPDDPNWMVASDAPVENWLGRLGASLSHPIIMIVGRAAWLAPLLFVAWGLRLAGHWGEERALGRLVFAPISVAVAAVYAATLAPGLGWPHSFGLGGLFGDTVLSVILTVLPVGPGLGAKLMSLAAGLATLGILAYALGFTLREVRTGLGWLIWGIVISYDLALRLLRRSAGASAEVARGAKARLDAGRARRATDEADLEPTADARPARAIRPEPVSGAAERSQPPLAAPAREAEPAPRRFLGALFQRGADPDVALPPPELADRPTFDGEVDAPDDSRIRSRIVDAIRARREADAEQTLSGRRAEPPLTAARRPDPADEPDVFEDEDAAPAPLTAEPLFETARQAAPRRPLVQQGKSGSAPSSRARAEAEPPLPLEDRFAGYEPPPLSLLADPAGVTRHHLSNEALEENARMLESVLDDYGVKGEIVSVRPGPVVTMYELEPAPGLKASRVIGLADDIARSMSALSARVSTVPGRSVIGIELPNANREKVVLREILSARDFGDSQKTLPLALGKDIGGDAVIANLAKMPHLLIAGTTGSGKSVAINTMILSLLYKLSPEDCRLIMIDPKMLELSVYDGIPHLLSPVVTDPKKAVVALKWVVGEMEDRYRRMSKMGVRNIDGYNGRVREALARGECFERTVQTGFDEETGDPIFETEEIVPEKMPYIVVIVDEMADLMMVAGKEIEACIQRLAQMARASGIHLIMATQRPSVDVITGTIKANFPTRISFQVTSKIDSRTILGEQGAEQLLGMGDMLYMAGGSKITRVHGPFCSDEEVEEIVTHLKGYGAPDYVSGVLEGPADDRESDIDAVLGLGATEGATGDEALYDMAVQIAARDRKCSTSYIQRKLAIGYNKAARLVEQMEEQGIISAANHVGKREVLVPEPH